MKTYSRLAACFSLLMFFSCNKGDALQKNVSGDCDSGKVVKSVVMTDGVIWLKI